MNENEYDIGDIARVRGGFTNRPLTAAELKTFLESGTLPVGTGVAPATVVCAVRKPDGTNVSPAPAVTGAGGVYTAEVTLDQSGTWWYAFDGTGGQQASGERSLTVRKRRVTRP